MKTLEIESPEAVVLRMPIASVVSRAFAFGLDLFLIGLTTILVVVAGATLTALSSLGGPLAFALIGMFLVRHFYFTFFEVVWHGATPGKRWLGLRVVSRDGSGLSVDAVITRNLLRDVEIFLPLTLIVAPEQVFGNVPAWIWAPALLWTLLLLALPLITKERLRAGDLAGGTVVVQVPKAELIADEAARASLAPAMPGQPAYGEPAPIRFAARQLTVYGERELETLADLIRKVDEGRASLEDQAHIARTIAKKIGYEGPEPSREPTRFLRSFYKQQRAALERQLLFGKRKASKHDR